MKKLTGRGTRSTCLPIIMLWCAIYKCLADIPNYGKYRFLHIRIVLYAPYHLSYQRYILC